MEVHVCDVNDRVGLAARNTLVAQKKEHVIELNGMSNGVTHMVSKIIEEAGDSMIDTLAIWGHGGPGSVGISRGQASVHNADWAGIDIENLIEKTTDREEEKLQKKRMRSTLRKLWNVLNWDAVVELRGCSIASGVRGQVLLTALANIWEVPVRAGNVDQYGPKWGWVGTVHEARPGMSGTTTFQGNVKTF